MIYIFKLTTGEDIIGVLENSPLTTDEYYNIIDPMTIVGARDDAGSTGMRLRDTLMLAETDILTLANKNVMTFYPPVTQLARYYQKASEYARRFTRPMILEQIEVAISELERDIADEELESSKLGDILRKITGSTLQ